MFRKRGLELEGSGNSRPFSRSSWSSSWESFREGENRLWENECWKTMWLLWTQQKVRRHWKISARKNKRARPISLCRESQPRKKGGEWFVYLYLFGSCGGSWAGSIVYGRLAFYDVVFFADLHSLQTFFDGFRLQFKFFPITYTHNLTVKSNLCYTFYLK